MSMPPLLLKMENGISAFTQSVSIFKTIIVVVSIVLAHQSAVSTRLNIVNTKMSGCMTNILKPPPNVIINKLIQCITLGFRARLTISRFVHGYHTLTEIFEFVIIFIANLNFVLSRTSQGSKSQSYVKI